MTDAPLPDPTPVDVDLSDPQYYLNRELSELAFQRRVLYEAIDDRNPLLERVRFLGLFTRNLDEFFMKRVGGLEQQIEAGITERSVDGLTPAAQWEAVMETARPMLARRASVIGTRSNRPSLTPGSTSSRWTISPQPNASLSGSTSRSPSSRP